MEKVILFVDGFNLYHALDNKQENWSHRKRKGFNSLGLLKKPCILLNMVIL